MPQSEIEQAIFYPGGSKRLDLSLSWVSSVTFRATYVAHAQFVGIGVILKGTLYEFDVFLSFSCAIHRVRSPFVAPSIGGCNY